MSVLADSVRKFWPVGRQQEIIAPVLVIASPAGHHAKHDARWRQRKIAAASRRRNRK